MLSDDYYQILGVPHNASEREIKRAYRRMVKLYHPDLNPDLPDAERSIRAVLIAYQTLGDRRRRADYDRVMQLFGPRRAAPPPSQHEAAWSAAARPSAMERRRHEARRPVLVWLIFVLTGVLVYYLWQSDVFSRHILRHWSITPTIYSYSGARKESSAAFTLTKTETDEDLWYLWYRTMNYRFLNGSLGSARELAEAYVSAARHAVHRGDTAVALQYALAAVRTDPTCQQAVGFLRSLQEQQEPAAR